MTFSNEFISAFNHAMQFEVGPWWNPNDPETQSGACATAPQRKKTGYVNIVQDRGGLTKFGVAQNANPDVDVQNLNLAQAMQIYYNRYWLAGHCEKVPYPVQIMHFDACINHGVGRAAKMLQSAVGVNPDGAIGPMTIQAISRMNPRDLIEKLNSDRVNRFQSIVNNNESQRIFLRGWLNRAQAVYQYALSKL